MGSGDTTCLTTGGSFLAKSGGELTNGFFITGGDTWMHVSGAIDGRTTSGSAGIPKSTVAFGGDVVISGSMRAKQVENWTSAYSQSDTQGKFIPMGSSLVEGVPAGYRQFAVMPFSGRLLKVVWRPSNGQSNPVSCMVHKGVDGDNTTTTSLELVTAPGNPANYRTHQFNFTQFQHFNEGDIVGIEITPSTAPEDVVVTMVFEFNMFI